MEGVIFLLGLFGVVPFIIWVISRYRHKSHESSAEIMKTLIDKGEPLTPDVIRSLGIRPRRKHGDLRTGLILIALAVATIFLGGAIPEEEAQRAFGGLAMFPLLVGLVYVGLWTFIGRKDPES